MQGGFPNPYLLAEHLHRKDDRDGSRMERRRLHGKTHSWQQELGKERRLLAEREEPRLEPSRTVRRRGGNRTSSMAGIRSYTPLPQDAWGGLQFDPHTEERAQEGKSALSLRGVARKALEAVSAWDLSLLGVAWKVLKTAPS